MLQQVNSPDDQLQQIKQREERMSFGLYKYQHEKYGPCMMLLYDPEQSAPEKVRVINNDEKTIPVNKRQDDALKTIKPKISKSPPAIKDNKSRDMRKSPPIEKINPRPYRPLKRITKESKEKSLKPSVSLPKGNISKDKSLRIKSTQKLNSFSKKKKVDKL